MITQVKMPAVNANEEQGTLVRWFFADGALLGAGKPICEIETTKATIEIEAPTDGYLQQIIEAGQKVPVGGLLGVIKTEESEVFVQDVAPEGTSSRRWTKKAFLVARRLGVNIEELADAKNDVVTENDVIQRHEAGFSANTERLKPLEPTPLQAGWERILLLAGAGGAGSIALDGIARSTGKLAVAIVDNNKRSHGTYVQGVPVVGGSDVVPELLANDAFDGAVLLFSEDIEERRRQFEMYRGMGVPFTNLIDPSVQTRTGVKMGVGNVIFPNCFFAVDVELGDNNFFASHNVVEHHSVIGNNCTFGPRTTLSGRVTVGNSVKFGMGVCVEPYLTIGEGAIIASGKVITGAVAPNARIRDKITVGG